MLANTFSSQLSTQKLSLPDLSAASSEVNPHPVGNFSSIKWCLWFLKEEARALLEEVVDRFLREQHSFL